MNGWRRVLVVVVAVAAVLFSDSCRSSTPTRVVVALAPSAGAPLQGRHHRHATATTSTTRRSSSSRTPQHRRGVQFVSSSFHQWQLNANHPSAQDPKATTSFRDIAVRNQEHAADSKPIDLSTAANDVNPGTRMIMPSPSILMMTSWSIMGLLFIPEAAQAAAVHSPPAVVPTALVAYAHYASLLVCAGLLTYERTTVEAGMSAAQEKNLVIADAAYGITALLVGGSGIYRVLEYGKGWDFYSHEPIFWLKLTLVGLWASLSLFPTITFVRRGIPLFQGRPEEVEPMSAALARRLQQVITAELSALLTIPLTATLMARGVGYNNDFPWPVGAALVTLVTAGSAFVYAKQALTWTEETDSNDNLEKQ